MKEEPEESSKGGDGTAATGGTSGTTVEDASLPLADKVAAVLRQQAYAKGETFLPVQDIDSLTPYVAIMEFMDQAGSYKNVGELDTHKENGKKIYGSSNQLKDSVTKSASKLTGHLENLRREKERAAKTALGKKERDAVAQAKKAAKKAAEDVKSAEKEVPNLFALSADVLQQYQACTFSDDDLKQEGSGNMPDMCKPCVFKLATFNAEWLQLSKVQMALSSYGGQYKAQTVTKDTGKGQVALRAKAGKEESDNALKKFAQLAGVEDKLLQLDSQDGQLLKETWLFGYMPGKNFVNPTPQGLAMLKVLAAGTAQMFMFKLSELCPAIKTLRKVDINGENAHDILLAMTESELLELNKVCPMYYTQLDKAEAVFVPSGFLVVERSGPEILIYGLRKTFCLKGDEEPYQAVIDYVKASNRDVSRHQQMLDAIRAAQPQPPSA